MGLGCGGVSRLGQKAGKSETDSIALIHQALDQGINFIDTAEAYDTEKIIGKALSGFQRTNVVLSTKASMFPNNALITPQNLVEAVESSLRNLNTDYLDIFHFHAVENTEYQYVVDELVATLMQLRDAGKIRFLGITEKFLNDPMHRMMTCAVKDNCWDVIGIGFNLLNQSARTRVLTTAIRNNIGVLGTFAVRRALSSNLNLKVALSRLLDAGVIEKHQSKDPHPLRFLFHEQGAVSLPDAAYRYSRHEPGMHVVLFSTGNLEHLQANIASLLRPALPKKDIGKLQALFKNVDNFSGQW